MGVYIDKIDLVRLSEIRVAPARSVLDVLQGFNLIEIDLVRCGECKWWNRDGKRKDGKGWCENAICGLTKPNAFCSYGERRADCEDETDEEWYDWRDEQEYEDRWERRADEHNTERD